MFQTGIEDIVKPLVTCMARKNIDVNRLFAKYDANKNMMMSAAELQHAVKELLQWDLSADEVKVLHEYFRAKHRRSEIRKMEFQELLKKASVRKYDSGEARAALLTLRSHLQKTGHNIEPALTSVFRGEATLRGFKLAIFGLNCLTSQQINNLAKYMDRHNNGMIKIVDVTLALHSPEKYDPKTLMSDGSLSQTRGSN